MRWGRVREFGIAFAIIVGGVLARLALDQVIPNRLPFSTFFPTVALIAYFCSRRTTLFALLAAPSPVFIGLMSQLEHTLGATMW